MWKIPVSNRLMDLQNYPRSRKSKRIQQPEALDSKTCSTFPVMAGSSFVRMSDGQVLPLQLLKKKLCRSVYNWKAGPTPVGPRLSHWHWYCQTQSYLHFERCIWMTSIEPSRLWETRAGYREMPIQIRAVDVMAGGRGGVGPAPSIRHQEPGAQAGICTIMILAQTFQQLHIRYLVSVLLQCSGNACEQYAEDLEFEAHLHLFWTLISIGMNWYGLVCTRMYQYEPVWTSMYGYIHVCTGMC